MSDLPHDLVEEILSRVPATALSRFRATCKRWDALFKDKRFTKKHFDRAPKQFMHLMLNQHRFSSLNLHGIENNNNKIVAPCIEFKGEFSLKDPLSSPSSGKADIFQVFHCDGLLLCHTKNGRLLVCNPCTGETEFISKRYCKDFMFAFGYENNKSCRNYKILSYLKFNDVRLVEIYEFSSGSWRYLKGWPKYFNLRSLGVSLKGNTYWIDGNSLLSFDFSTEAVGSLCLPVQACFQPVLSTVREEQLSVLLYNSDSSNMEIWVTTTNDKIDHSVVLSWRKLFAIIPYSLFFCSCVSFFILEKEKKIVACCGDIRRYNTLKNKVCVIGSHGVYRDYYFGEMTEESGRAMIFNYVPSLVQIQQKETLN